MKIKNTFIKSLREGLELTQQELAVAAGVSQEAISQIEAGRRNPSSKVLYEIAKALKCKMDELVEGDS